jgi:hypothetical protein
MAMTVRASGIGYRLMETRCLYCRVHPCECAPLARCLCACGADLEAADDLEAKRRTAEQHTRSMQHLAWRER